MSDNILDGVDVKIEKPPCKCYGRKVILIEGEIVPCPDCTSERNSPLYEVDPGARLDIIPPKFRGLFFDFNIIFQDIKIPQEIRKDTEFLKFLKGLEKIVYNSSNGKLSSKSLFVAAPPGFGKNHAVYAAIEGGLKAGLTAAPYLDAGELKELIDRGNLKSDYYEADLCFIKITSGNVSVSDLHTAKLITERRARRDKPTIVTSRMPINYFAKMEPSIFELIRKDVVEGDYFRWQYVASPFIFYEGKR